MILRLSRTLAEAIQSETEAAAPRECCGLLLGDQTTMLVTAILPAANVAPDPLHRFEIDPATLLGAYKAARAGGPQVLGHYHSHPDGEPVPSAIDDAMAQGDGEIWLIIGKRGAMRAWQASQSGELYGRFSEIEIESGLARTGADRH